MKLTNKTARTAVKLAGMALLAATCQVQAAELLVTPAAGKGGAMNVALDLASEGDVSGFNFTINVGKGGASSANLSKCVADLPKGFTGECRLTNGKVIVFAMADRMTTLPAGVVSIGTLSLRGTGLAKGGAAALTVEEMEFVDVKGVPLQAKSRVE